MTNYYCYMKNGRACNKMQTLFHIMTTKKRWKSTALNFSYLLASFFFLTKDLRPAHTEPAKNTLEYVPASKPTIRGSANSLIESTPKTYNKTTGTIVVSVVYIERFNV